MSKNTKRKYLTEGLIANILIFIVFISLVSFYAFPQIMTYEKQKKELLNNYENLQKIEKEGISYEDFLSMGEKITIKDTYLQNLIKILPEEFYEENIKNTSENNHQVFMKKKKTFLEEKEKEGLYTQEKNSIKKILPEYAGNMIIDEEGILTDFAFINSIEKLFYRFKLESDAKIGVSKLIKVSDEKDKSTEESLDTKIYYIPFSTSLVGKKSSLLNFLLFTEKVGSIEIKEGEVKAYPSIGLNNYESQLFDIERIILKDYIDSSNMGTQRGEQADFTKEELINFLKKEQGNEKIEADVNLRFFVRGMPEYQVKDYINTTLERYTEIKKRSQKILAQISMIDPQNTEEVLTINKLKSINFDIKSLEKDIKNIKAFLAKAQKLGNAYQSAEQLNTVFNLFEESFDKADEIIENLKSK